MAAKAHPSSKPRRAKHRSAMALYAKPAHKRMARMLGFALTLGDETTWWFFAAVAFALLTREERAALAWAALWALDDDDANAVVEAVWS